MAMPEILFAKHQARPRDIEMTFYKIVEVKFEMIVDLNSHKIALLLKKQIDQCVLALGLTYFRQGCSCSNFKPDL